MRAFRTAFRYMLAIGCLVLLVSTPVQASEASALEIVDTLRQRHLPFGTVLDPIFASPSSFQIVGYTRCGDSAIWTGHYLAAEAFRYKVAQSGAALANVRLALQGIDSLVRVTGTNLLARCLIPAGSQFAPGITREEAHNGVYNGNLNGAPYVWIGNTSRDQYIGVFFGLAVAWDLITDTGTRTTIADVVTRMLDFLLQKNWAVVMPNGGISTVFTGRADQQLTLLQIGRLVNPTRFESTYKLMRVTLAATVGGPIALEVLDDHNSYFKFNLDTINFYNLIRFEDDSYSRWWYVNAYDLLRRTTDDDGNAHFNMIDRALKGANATRDQETHNMLNEWLRRSRRDEFVDLRGRYPACGVDRACTPIPVIDRVRTDFLWQRSPLLLFGGGSGLIEGAGIDDILPYWMARYYGIERPNVAPSAVSVTPSSGAGRTQTLSFLFSDPNGSSDLRVALLVINPILSAAASCHVYFDRASNSVYLMNDIATAWFGPANLGAATTLQNGRCAVHTGSSSTIQTGNNLTLNLSFTFLPPSGTRTVFMYTQDRAGFGSGWQQRGTWTVP